MERMRPGDDFGGYRVLGPWREGSMAVLYRVVAPGGSEYLLKRPRLGFGSHPACYAGFDAEQAILERLAGPHVPALRASGEDDAGPWLVMERVAGTSLADLVASAPLPAEQVARIGAALATALHDIHRQDVVHHDLKPAHVILRPDGGAVLIDFGLAFHGGLPDLAAAEADGPLGTAAYLSPEQVRGRRGDPRSDIFSAGALLYALATGRLPWGDPATGFGLRLRLRLDPPAPRDLRPGLPEWLQEILLRCLEGDATARYASAAQLAHDLAHPEQVAVGERGRRRGRGGWRRLLARACPSRPAPGAVSPAAHLAAVPHVMVAVDTGGGDALAAAIREAVRGIVRGHDDWRVTCVAVLEPSVATEQDEAGELTRAFHAQRLAELHHWARPLGLPREQLRFHVIVGGDAAGAIVDYARRLHADHVVLGARGASGLRRLLGSVSSRVAAEAPCSVTVVRTGTPADARPAGSDRD